MDITHIFHVTILTFVVTNSHLLNLSQFWEGWDEAVALQGPIPTADELAQTILFLASDASNHITGQDIVVDGGLGYQNKDAKL